MEEIWKDIEEFKGVYQVSNIGRVRRIGDYSNQHGGWELLEPRIMAQVDNGMGYLHVALNYKNKHYHRYVHILVDFAFCENKNPIIYKEVNHKDGNKTNNYAENLEWCDRSYNNKHAYANGLHTLHGCYGKKKKVAQLDMKTNKILNIYDSVENAAKSLGVDHFANISACCNCYDRPEAYKKYAKSYKGFRWRFATEEMKIGDVI